MNIGAFTPDTWRGTLQGPRKSVETFQRAGVPGNGVVVGAAHGQESQIETVALCTDLAAAATLVTTLEAIVGTVVSVTDDAGRTFDLSAVLSAQSIINSCKGVSGKTALVTTQWSILPGSST